MKRTNKKGFTLVELVIVIAIIAILAAVLIPTFSGVVENANQSSARQAARNAYTELMAVYNADLKSAVTGEATTAVINSTDDSDAGKALKETGVTNATITLNAENGDVSTVAFEVAPGAKTYTVTYTVSTNAWTIE